MHADLHIHTTASDGSYSPAQAVAQALNHGLCAVSITDHDTVSGLDEAIAAGMELGVEVIPGIELSALDGDKEIHVLGYYIDHHSALIRQKLDRFIETRKTRAYEMVTKLNRLGVDISLDRVKEIAGSEFIGRPHIAKAMLEKGYIGTIADAFSARYIGRGGRAYTERFVITPEQAITLIKDARGIPVLAHPGYLSDGTFLCAGDIVRFTAYGLAGMEVYYSRHTPEQVESYHALAVINGLLITGGSDCHGQAETLFGRIRLPYKYVKALKDAQK